MSVESSVLQAVKLVQHAKHVANGHGLDPTLTECIAIAQVAITRELTITITQMLPLPARWELKDK